MTLEGYTYKDGALHGEGGGAFRGATYVGDGKFILTPALSSFVGIYDAVNDIYTRGPATLAAKQSFIDGVLLSNGKVLFTPQASSHVGLYDPVNNTFAFGAAHTGAHPSLPYSSKPQVVNDDLVVFIPHYANAFGRYNPTNNTFTNGPSHGLGIRAFSGGAKTPAGIIVCVPEAVGWVGLYNPLTNVYVLGPYVNPPTTNSPYAEGVLTQDGTKVIFVPYNSPYVGIYDIASNTFSNGPAHGKGLDMGAFEGGALSPDGNIVFFSSKSTTLGIYNPYTNVYSDGPAVTGGLPYGFSRGGWDGASAMVLSPFNNERIGVLTVPFTPPEIMPEPVRSPKLLIRWRNDGKSEWSNSREIFLGDPGDYEIMKRIRGLGHYFTRQYEIVCISGKPITIAGIDEEVTDR